MSISGLYLEQQISLEASGAASMHAVWAIAAQAYGAPGKVKAAFAAESSKRRHHRRRQGQGGLVEPLSSSCADVCASVRQSSVPVF